MLKSKTILRISFFILLFLIGWIQTSGQEFVLNGKVIDETTEKPLAFVHVIINNSQQGNITDIDGKFALESNEKIKTIHISYVGYEPKTVLVNDKREYLVVKMKQTQLELSEVEILPGENPAHRIIKNVIENLNRNNPQKMDAFSYTSYNKFFFTGDQENVSRKDTSMITDDQVKVLEKLKEHHFFMMESVTEQKFKYPDKVNEVVKGTRISGFRDPFFVLIATQMQSFSFYKPTIEIWGKRYISPLNKAGLKKYLFLMQDTMYQGQDTVFMIYFRPWKGSNFDGMKGMLYVNNYKWAIQNVIAEPYYQEDDFSVKIQQQYELVNDTTWFPAQLNTDILFADVFMNEFPLIGVGRSYLKHIKINPELQDKDFNNVVMEYDENAGNRDSTFWSVFRVDSLTRQELRTYEYIDSLGKKYKFDKRIKGFMALAMFKARIGPVDLDLNKILDYNEYEGSRVGIGLETNDKVLKWMSVGGYYGYGFKDKKNKYGGHVQFNIHKKHEVSLTASYKNDLFQTGGLPVEDDRMILNTNQFYRFLRKKFDREKNIKQQLVSGLCSILK